MHFSLAFSGFLPYDYYEAVSVLSNSLRPFTTHEYPSPRAYEPIKFLV